MFTARESALGKYRLIAEIAHGGMGVVYLAMVQGPGGFNKLVVVKELKPELVEEPAFLTMFLDEARLAARLSHPNIVQTNEVGNDGDRYFLAMEYLDGRGLDQVRRRMKTAGFGLSPSMHLRIIADMLAGLEYAHTLSDFDGSPLHIVHRDVSPQNVFVTFSGHVKLLDFGIAKARSSSHETSAGIVKGKLSYMSPEQARGLKADARADVFSAGVMLWEALTGRRLHGGRTDQETLRALVAGQLPRASSARPGIPQELDEICARALAWNRDERYPSAAAFQEDLEDYLTSINASVSTRDVGECMSGLFHEERARTSALIEAYVAHARSGAARGEVPVIDVGSLAASGTPSSRSGSGRPFSGAELTDPPSSPSSNHGLATPSGRRPLEIARSRYRSLAVAGVAAVATLAVVGLAWRPGSTSEAPASTTAWQLPQAAPAPAPPPTAAAAAPLPQQLPPAPPVATEAPPIVVPPARRNTVNVEIRVSPASARLEIDDAELASNPFAGTYLADDLIHRVRASAPGYITKTVAITFDANVKLDLSLERIAPRPDNQPNRRTTPARPASPATAPPPPPEPARPEPARPEPPPPSRAGSATPAIDPAGGNRPLRPIDPNNPYGGVP
jgi:eukaryotic-like serine/threonine-protein kinase